MSQQILKYAQTKNDSLKLQQTLFVSSGFFQGCKII